MRAGLIFLAGYLCALGLSPLWGNSQTHKLQRVAQKQKSSLSLENTTAPSDVLFRKLDVLVETLGYVENYYIDNTNATDLVYHAAVGAVGTLDVHSGFFAPENYRALVRATEHELALTLRQLLPKIGYVQIKSFARHLAQDLTKALHKHPEWYALVLDLRDNPGGLLDEAAAVCDLFLEDGLIVAVVGRQGSILTTKMARPRHTPFAKLKLAVLIDKMSASAAEIVAAALQDHQRAHLFGEKSYGKGSVQSMVDLSDGSGLKLTIARYRTPKGRSIDGIGVIPDTQLALGHLPNNNDNRDVVLAAAVRHLQQAL